MFKKDDKLVFRPVRNSNLTCANCMFRLDDTDKPCNTSKCQVFENQKPAEILTGGDCDFKEVF